METGRHAIQGDIRGNPHQTVGHHSTSAPLILLVGSPDRVKTRGAIFIQGNAEEAESRDRITGR